MQLNNYKGSGRRRASSVSSTASAELVDVSFDHTVLGGEQDQRQSINNQAGSGSIVNKHVRPRSNSQPLRSEVGTALKWQPLEVIPSATNFNAVKTNGYDSDAKLNELELTQSRMPRFKDADINVNFSKMSQGPTLNSQSKPGSLADVSRRNELNLETKSYHYYGIEELSNYASWINATLEPEKDPDLTYLFPDGKPLPVDGDQVDEKLFKAIADGFLLSKLIFITNNNAIDLGHIWKNPKNKTQALENNHILLSAAKKMGVKLNNVGPEDIYKGVPHLCLGIISQIIKAVVLSKINFYSNPELKLLLNDSEDVSKITNETLLMKWVNFHLAAAQSNLRINNFTTDLKSAEVLGILMKQLVSHEDVISADVEQIYQSFINQKDVRRRYEYLLQMSSLLGCKKVLTVDDILNGNKDHMVTFLGQLLVKFPNLEEALNHHVQKAKNASLENLEMERIDSKNHINQLNSHIYNLKLKVDELEKINANLEANLKIKTHELEACKEEVESLREDETKVFLQDKEVQCDEQVFKDQFEQLQQELVRLRSELETVSHDKQTIESTKILFEKRIESLERNLDVNSQKFSELTAAYKSTSDEKATLTNRLQNISNKSDELKRLLEGINAVLDVSMENVGLEVNKTAQLSAKMKLESIIDSYKSTLSNMYEENKTLKNDLLETKKDLLAARVHETEISANKKEINDLKAVLHEKDLKIVEMEMVSSEVKKENERLSGLEKFLPETKTHSCNVENHLSLQRDLELKNNECQHLKEVIKIIKADFKKKAETEKAGFRTTAQNTFAILEKARVLREAMEANKIRMEQELNKESINYDQKHESILLVSKKLENMVQSINKIE